MKYYVELDDRILEMDIEEQGEDLKVIIDGKTLLANLQKVSAPSLYSLILDNESHEVFVDQSEGQHVVIIAGEQYTVRVQDERAKRLAAVTPKERSREGEVAVRAPMPGLVVAVNVNPGDVVEKGKGLLILEAMKMQNELRAPKQGTVMSVNVKQGDRVDNGRVLVVIT